MGGVDIAGMFIPGLTEFRMVYVRVIVNIVIVIVANTNIVGLYI